MFGVDSLELFIVVVLAIFFIGPKELPTAMLKVGRFVGKIRGYTRHFTAGIENAMREAELEEMERKWREENQRILAQYPADGIYPDPVPDPAMMPIETPAPAQPDLPLSAPAAPDDDPTPPTERPLP